MVEENGIRVSSDNSNASNDACQSRQRKRRKWDEPAEPLVSAGIIAPGVAPLGNNGSIMGTFTGVASVPGAILANSRVGGGTAVPTSLQAHLLPQSTSLAISKFKQPKIQDELVIAREIVINDADSSVRYKLTQRLVQEEIQRSTGSVVITRGKYHPPNAPADGEKPLYLHISAAAHLKDTAERILAVDRAAAMVEEMMKTGNNLQFFPSSIQTANGKGVKAQTTCVFLGFDADPSLNVAARIHGPNDHYINHIMNETGATVVLRGHGSGNCENLNGGEEMQPLHLFLSATNSKSLEDAKRLAEHLLDTISLEFGATRFSSSKVYGAVPPPQNLLAGVQTSSNDQRVNTSPSSLPLPIVSSVPSIVPAISSPVPVVSTAFVSAIAPQYGAMMNNGLPQVNIVGYSQPKVAGGTSYIGYQGIYPQATPLQQVAQALRQSVSPIMSTVAPATSSESKDTKPSTSSSSQQERGQTRRRKFQELPVGVNGPAKSFQEAELFLKPDDVTSKKPEVHTSVNGMTPMPSQTAFAPPPERSMPPPPPRDMMLPPPRNMPPPPPPPKFSESKAVGQPNDKDVLKIQSDKVPDTLTKLMEYGDEDDDDDETVEESVSQNSAVGKVQKPFWAV